MLGRCKETNTILETCPIKGHSHFMGQVVDPLARAPAVNTQQPLGGLLTHRVQVHQVNREVEAERAQCSQGYPYQPDDESIEKHRKLGIPARA
jgi:hypothetical protein